MSLEQILDRLRSAEDETDRAKAAKRLGDYEGERVILALIEAMGDDQLVSVAAMESLKRCRPNPAPYLQQALLADTRLLIRRGAAGLLAHFPSRETEGVLREALKDESPHVRGDAARSLRRMVTEQATLAALEELLDDPQSFPRYQALLTVRAFDPQLVDEAQIIQHDLHSNDAMTQVAAIHFIRENHRQEWLADVDGLIDHPDFRVRRAANWARDRLHQEMT